MINAIKEYVMVNQLDDRASFKSIDSDNARLTKLSAISATTNKDPIENVHLSQTSKQLEALKALILSEPEMNMARITFIKEAIAEGRYEINSEKIAASILADAMI